MKRISIYWLCQIAGWFAFILLNLVFIHFTGGSSEDVLWSFLFIYLYGILSTHIFRNVIIRFDLLLLNPFQLISLFLFSSLVLGFSLHFFQRIFLAIVLEIPLAGFFSADEISAIINLALVYLIWSLIYFLVHFIENYKRKEIRRLRYEALRNEMEFNTLKAQLNPHFLFNALNSIRALIDENPSDAKVAVTGLSTMLRTSLQLGKQKFITLDDEIQLVREYLRLEGIRYEERLQTNIHYDPVLGKALVPPMILQTLVENAIKHGISRLPKGGKISIAVSDKESFLYIHVVNSGSMNEIEGSSGVGLRNIRQRLKLLFGEIATFKVMDSPPSAVSAELLIPLIYEDTVN